jgi:hypothetical protein
LDEDPGAVAANRLGIRTEPFRNLLGPSGQDQAAGDVSDIGGCVDEQDSMQFAPILRRLLAPAASRTDTGDDQIHRTPTHLLPGETPLPRAAASLRPARQRLTRDDAGRSPGRQRRRQLSILSWRHPAILSQAGPAGHGMTTMSK